MIAMIRKHSFLTALVFLAAAFQVLPAQSGKTRDQGGDRQAKSPAEKYTLEQALSEKAQINTIAFSGLAFLTGTYGADTFLPPGKVADYFGFQYMRDIDAAEAGHNMMFLTDIAYAVLGLLTEDQLAMMIDLASEQTGLYSAIAEKRWVMIQGFRENLGRPGDLSRQAVEDFTSEIFALDGDLSLGRAELFISLTRSLDENQKHSLEGWAFGDSSTWPRADRSVKPENLTGGKRLTHDQQVLVMTFASEFFSWYRGSEEADVYFCPERQGTYFGGFYMKDYPAMGNADYFIPTDLTGDSGEEFLAILDDSQRSLILDRLPEWMELVWKMADVRRAVSQEIRGALGEDKERVDGEMIDRLSREYGRLDGAYSWLMADSFARIGSTLTAQQKKDLVTLRNQNVFPEGLYKYAEEVSRPEPADTSFLFGGAVK